MQQGRLPASGRPHDGDELPIVDREVDAAQRVHGDAFERVVLLERAGFDKSSHAPRLAGAPCKSSVMRLATWSVLGSRTIRRRFSRFALTCVGVSLGVGVLFA